RRRRRGAMAAPLASEHRGRRAGALLPVSALGDAELPVGLRARAWPPRLRGVGLAQTPLGWPMPCSVTVQVVKTGITPPLATSGRFWGAEMERLHHARRLHAQQGGTPRHCAAVASTSPPPSSCLRQSASPPHSASQNCPCATARLDGALSLPCCSS